MSYERRYYVVLIVDGYSRFFLTRGAIEGLQYFREESHFVNVLVISREDTVKYYGKYLRKPTKAKEYFQKLKNT